MRKLSRKALVDTLRACKWDLEEVCASLGISREQIAVVMSDAEMDSSWLAIQATIDLHMMQRANRLLDAALTEVESVLAHSDDEKTALSAAKIAIDFHGAASERIQLPALMAKVESAMSQLNEWGYPIA